jgi:hypothetical protein
MNTIQEKDLRRLAIISALLRPAVGGPVEQIEAAYGDDNRRWLRRRAHAAVRRRLVLAALLLVLAVAVPSAVRLSAPHGVITSTGDPHEAYLAACYAIENQSLPMA